MSNKQMLTIFKYVNSLLGGRRDETTEEARRRGQLEDLEARSWYKGVFLRTTNGGNGPIDDNAKRLQERLLVDLEDAENKTNLPPFYKNVRRGEALPTMSEAEERREHKLVITIEVPHGHIDLKIDFAKIMNYEKFVEEVQKKVPEFDRVRDLGWQIWKRLRENNRSVRFTPTNEDGDLEETGPESNMFDVTVTDQEAALGVIVSNIQKIAGKFDSRHISPVRFIFDFKIRIGDARDNIQGDVQVKVEILDEAAAVGRRVFFRVAISVIKTFLTRDRERTEIENPVPEPKNSLAVQFLLRNFHEAFFDPEPSLDEAPMADRDTWEELRMRAFQGLLDTPTTEEERAAQRGFAQDYRRYAETHYVPEEWSR